MRRLGISAIIAILATASLSAQEVTRAKPASYGKMSDAELVAAFAAAKDTWTEDSCGVGEPLLTELYKRRPEAAIRNSLLWSRVLCFDTLKKYGEARSVLAELEPQAPPGAMLSVGLYLDNRLGDTSAMLDRLSRFADHADEEHAESFKADDFYFVRRRAHESARQEELEAIALKLYRSRAYPAFEPEMQAAIAFSALKPAAGAEDPELVEGLLGQLRSPQSYSGLLSLREYEAIWPAIERRVGDNFSTISAEYREWTDARFSNFPNDRDRFSEAAHALYFDGRFQEAAALARQWRERQGSLENMEEGDAWALNIEAYALDALGRIGEADAVFDQIAALPAEGRDWLVNFVINRASRLVGQRRFAEGLAAAQLARPIAEKYGSTYAKMLIAHDHACALHALGRKDEAAREIPFVRENADAALTVAAETMMCIGRRDEALAMLLAGIEKPQTRDSVVDGLLPDGYDLFYTTSLLPDTREFLSESPELRAAYTKWARDIPERFIPAASRKRVPLKN